LVFFFPPFLVSRVKSEVSIWFFTPYVLALFSSRGVIFWVIFLALLFCERASLVLCYSSSIRGFCVDSVVSYDFFPSYCSPGRGGLG
jgi:hypothetical protein